MKKSIFKKLGGLFLGLAMGLGVVTGVTAGNKVSEVNAAGVSETLKATEMTDNSHGTAVGDDARKVSENSPISYVFGKGTEANTAPTFYDVSGSATIRMYVNKNKTKGDYVTITSSGTNYITSVTISGSNKQGSCSWVYSKASPIAASEKCLEVTATLKETGNSKAGQYTLNSITVTYEKAVTNYTVSFAVNTSGYGTVSQSSIANVPSGTPIEKSDNTVTINGTTVTATPAANTAQYTYAFTGWSNYTGTVTADRTITANFTRTTNSYSVGGTIGNGKLSDTSSVSYSDKLDINIEPSTNYTYPETLNSVTMGGSTLTAGSGYTYDKSTGAISIASVTGNVVINATCVPIGTAYTVTYDANGGTVSPASEEIIENGNPSFPVPTKNGFQFKGWQINGSGTAYTNPNEFLVTQDVEFVALWEAITMTSLTVTYTGGQPVLGTDFTFAGSITANMSNGTHPTVNLSDVTIGSVDKFTLNQQTITVTHKNTGATGTFNVTYKTKNITYTTSWDKASTIAVGDTIALAHIANGQVMTGVTNNIGTNGSATISNNKLTPASGVTIYELEVVTGNSTGSIALKHGNDYLSYSGSSNNISTSTTLNNNSSWTVTWSSGRPTITNVASNTRKIVYNTGSPRFCCYTSAQGGLDVFTKTQTASGTADIIKLNAALKSGKTFNEGAIISASDFDCSTLDNLNQTKTVTATSVSPSNLVAGENTITVYYNTWSTTVTVNAAEVAHLDHIEVVEGTGTRSFARESAFNSTGLKIKAYYSNTDKTKFPDRELTSGFTVTPLTSAQMNVADTYDVSVSYTENGVTKNTTYSVTVTPKVSTSVTIAGDGIEGSNGAYTLASGVTNEVELTLGCNGDETVEFVQGDQNVVTFANGVLSVNSSTKTSEQITVSFKAGSATATLTVNISAAEGIQLLSDEEIVGYVGSSFSYDINIKLDNVESATWDLPEGNFVIESETEDNSGFVGTIYFTAEVSDTLTFSVLTGKGETLSVDIEVLAVNDGIKSISASLKSGVTYSAGQGQTFSKDDLTVTCVRDSGARGTLDSDEFTVSGSPEGSFNRVASYDLTITSVENTNATSALTINVGMPSDLNLNFVTSAQVTEDGETYWKKVTDLSTISTSKKYAFIIEDGANSKIFNGVDDATADNAETPVGYINTSVSDGKATYTEGSPYLTINYNSSEETASIKCVGGSETLAGKYIYGKSGSNTITNGATETFMSFTLDDDNHIIAESNSTSFRFNATSNQNRFRFYKIATTGNSYLYPCLYELATKPGDSHLEYSNVNETTDTANKYDFAKLYNFIALANETYADICGSEGNNQKPDLDTWRSVLESDEYNALLADTNSYNLLKSAICGEGAYGSNGRYVPDGEKQSSAMVIEFLQKYDRVVSNYSSENYNYLGRDVTSPSPRINPILALNEVDSSVWVISAVALVGLTAIGGYFFYRKRKEN